MGTRLSDASPPQELSALRRRITELVAENALPMVQNAIDAVREDGQYQAMKYLFEMIGLYPAAAQEASPEQESLARILLSQLGLPETFLETQEAESGVHKQAKTARLRPVE